MTDEERQEASGMDKDAHPKTAQPFSTPTVGKEDEHASPLGRQKPAEAATASGPLSGGPSIAGQRGHDIQSQDRGDSGALTDANADAIPANRRGMAADEHNTGR